MSQYQWLDPSRREIRLLRLQHTNPQEPDDTIRGRIVTYSLDDAPSFDALSYAWGSSPVLDPIVINDVPAHVTPNLHDGLKYLYRNRVCEYIWIDAVCINQRDLHERSSQVALMREIFTKARNVHVWLGHSTDSTEEVLKILERAGRRLEPDFEDAESLPAELDNISKRDLAHVFHNDWWYRLWTVQEVVLAKNPIAHIGTHSIHFPRLLMGILAAFRLRDQAAPEGALPWYMMQLALKFSAPMTAAASDHAHMKLIPDLIAAVRESRVSVRHDRIYGILGLLPRKLAILPDYAKPLEEVYIDFTLRAIWCERSLDILALGGKQEGSDLHLPSWTPCFDISAPYLFRGTSGFDASKALASEDQAGYPTEIAQYLGDNRLAIWLQALGTIELALAVVPDEIDVQFLALSRESRNVNIDKLQQRVCECVVKLRSFLSGLEDAITLFWSVLVGANDLSERNIALGNDFRSWLFLRGSEKYLHSYDPVLWTLLSGKRVFLTNDGRYVGMVSGQAVTGDMLTILAGASTPCILRRSRHDEETFEYVGHAYCAGIMQGEAVTNAALALNHNECDVTGLFRRSMLV